MSGPHSEIQNFVLGFETQHPAGPDIVSLLNGANAKLIYLKPVRQAAPSRSWVLHVRLPRDLEEHFAITRACLVYCPATNDLQPRDTRRIRALIREAADQVEPDIAILATDDEAMRSKIEGWSVERELGITIVPVLTGSLGTVLEDEPNSSALRNLIEAWVSSHNLYDERSPVTGNSFYGRGGLLRDLERKLAQGRGHAGIFGLRRIGKTSVMLELKDRLIRKPGLMPVFIDLEATKGVGHAAFRIGQELTKTLAENSKLTENQARAAMALPVDWTSVTVSEQIARVTDAIRGAMTQGALKDSHLILMLDELETLIPSTKNPEPGAVDLFRALRGLSQETRRVTLVVAGVNADPTEAPLMGGIDNPLFGLISTEYLGPLSNAECEEMIRRVGRRMQINWDGPAAAFLSDYVGDHPLLARLAASDLAERFTSRPLRPTVDQAREVLDEFHERRSQIFQQMTISLQRYYPEEWEVLRVMASGDQVFASELLGDDRSMVDHLSGYGVIDRNNLSIKNSSFRRWLRSQN